jgi:hypothetical protein
LASICSPCRTPIISLRPTVPATCDKIHAKAQPFDVCQCRIRVVAHKKLASISRRCCRLSWQTDRCKHACMHACVCLEGVRITSNTASQSPQGAHPGRRRQGRQHNNACWKRSKPDSKGCLLRRLPGSWAAAPSSWGLVPRP